MDNLYERIAKANDEIVPFKMERSEKQKDGSYKTKQVEYAEVKERVIAFRKVYPDGKIKTYDSYTDNYVKFEAEIYDGEGKLIANAHARELLNKAFALENAETSAIGRALGFCGFGIKLGIASADDMKQVDSPSGVFDEDIEAKKKLVEQFKKLPLQTQADTLNMFRVKNPEELKTQTLEDIVKKK